MKRRAGFTLLELLVAILVTSILVAAIASAFSTGLRVWDYVQKKSDQNQEAAAILDAIAADMRGIWNDPQRSDKFLSCKYAGTTGADRDPDALYFTAFLPDKEDSRILRFVEITYRLDKKSHTLLRSEKPITSEQEEQKAQLARTALTAQAVSAAEEEVVTENVSRFDLRFYDGGSWIDQWPPANSISAAAAREAAAGIANSAAIAAQLSTGESAPTVETDLPHSIEISMDLEVAGKEQPRLLYSIVPIEFAHP